MIDSARFVFTNPAVYMAGVRGLNALAADGHGMAPARGLFASELATAAGKLRLKPHEDGYRFAPYDMTADDKEEVLHLRVATGADLANVPSALQAFRGWKCTAIEPSVVEPGGAVDLLFYVKNNDRCASFAWLTVHDEELREAVLIMAGAERAWLPQISLRLNDSHIAPEDRVKVRKSVAFAEHLVRNAGKVMSDPLDENAREVE